MRISKTVKACCAILAVVAFTSPVPCAAETTNDFKALYDEELKEGLLELWLAYGQAVNQAEEMRQDIVFREHYNSIIAQATLWQEDRCVELDTEIGELLDQQANIMSSVSDMFYGEFTELVALDASYKANKKVLDVLLEERNQYTAFSRREIDYEKLATMEEKAEGLETAYIESIDVAELGKVHGVGFPLGEPSEIRSPYGIRLDPMNPTTTRFHAGVDLKAAEGTPVLSIFHGTVTDAGWGPIGGYYVKIDHGDGIGSYYCHLSKLLCSRGQRVSQYDVVAMSGNTGSRTTGPHLHFALYIDGVSVDPAVLLCGE